MTIPKLTPYTGQVANPDGSQTQTEFTQNMFDQLSYEAQLATELDATIDGMNQAVTDVENNAAAASASATAAEASASTAGYQGLWPDTGGSADKGDTYQTQVGGTPTGNYYTALQNTLVDPVGDNVNWKVAVSEINIYKGDSQIVGLNIWPKNTTSSAAVGDSGLINVEAVRDVNFNRLFKIYDQFGQKSVSGTIDAIDFTKQSITISGTSYFLVNDKYDDMNPSAWGVQANNSADDWQAMTNFMTFYRYQVVIHVESGMVPSIAAPIMHGVANRILLSKPLVLYGYLNADFGATSFGRHPSWSAGATDYLLTSADLYKANFGGMSFYDTEYALNVENDNADQGNVNIEGVYFSLCDNALRVDCQSTKVTVSNFSFDNCPRAATIIRGDLVTFRSGTIYQGALTTTYGCTIEVNNASLVIDGDVLGVPSEFHTGQEIAWINNKQGGRVDIRSSRFGGEFGGCTTINQFGGFQKEGDPDPTPTGFKIHDSQCYSTYKQGSSKSCIVRLFKIPNFMSFKGNRGMTLTDEVITWGEGVTGKYSKVQEVLDLLSGYSFEYSGNLQIQSGSDYANELSPLFAPDDYIPLTVTSVPTSGVVNCDTRIKPENSAVYQLTIKGQTNPSGDANYESSFTCFVTVGSVFESPDVVRKATLTPLAQSPGGSGGSEQLVAQVRFWNGSVQSESADVTEDTWRLRVQVLGWTAGQEGAGFEGVINRIL